MSRGRAGLLSSVLAVSIVAAAVPAAAQDDPREEAAKLYKDGVEAYFGGDYAVAITKFRDGFELDPNAMFQYNLSLCFAKLQNPEEAREHAERAREIGGMPDEAKTKNDARIAAFSAQITSATIATELAEPGEEEIPTCRTDSDCNEGEVCNIRRGLCVEEIRDQATPDPLFSPYGWVGLGGTVVGAGLLAGAGIVSLNLKSITEEKANATGDRFDELGERERSARTSGLILLLSGGVLAAGGVTLVVLDLLDVVGSSGSQSETTESATGEARLIPVFAPDYAGFTWGLRF